MQNPSILPTQRDSKNDSNLGARREIQRRRRHAPSCMGATELQSNWPEMRKTLGKPLVLQRRGQEPNNLQIPWEKLGFQNEATRNLTRAAKQPTHRQRALQRTSDGFGIQVTRVCPAIFERTAVDSSCLHIPLSRICSLAAPAACRVLDRKSSQCSGSEHAEA